MVKKILIGLACLILGLIGLNLYIFHQTPNFMRNNEVDGVRMEAKIEYDERDPITKTLRAEDYRNLSEKKLEGINDKIAGRIEGDIPSIHLNQGGGFTLTFYKDGKKVGPEDLSVKITAYASDYRDPDKKREIKLEPISTDNKTYIYKTKRYSIQYEKYFIEYLRVEVAYKIGGKEYLSVFATNQDNANDGTDFFKNEDLEKPKEVD